MKAITVLGTTSQAGKSVLTTAICRLLSRQGVRVSPFKGASIGPKSYLTEVGGEMSYAQALQAWAAGIAPAVEMNPVFLAPTGGAKQGEATYRVCLKGKSTTNLNYLEFCNWSENEGWSVVRQSLDQLGAEFDVLICEGGGSTAEVHQKRCDLANMRVARYLNAATVLVVDSERGGAIAHVMGTLSLLEPIERALVRGIVVNKWRGSSKIWRSDVEWLEAQTGIPVLGVIPWNEIACSQRGNLNLLKRESNTTHSETTIAVIRLPHMMGFADLDPLEAEPSVRVKYVSLDRSLGYPDAAILPGSRSTIADLKALKESGIAREIQDYLAAGGTVMGIGGGFQILGQSIADPEGLDGDEERYEGLGIVPMVTVMTPHKLVKQRSVTSAYPQPGLHAMGTEIHRGRSQMTDSKEFHPLFDDERLGVVDKYQSVWGTYLHGLFDSGPWRRAWLNRLRQQRGLRALPTGIPNYREQRDTLIDDLADFVSEHFEIKSLLS